MYRPRRIRSERARDVVKERHGKLHIFVDDAGIGPTGADETYPSEDGAESSAINVDGIFFGVRAFTPLLSESGEAMAGGASIVNVSSMCTGSSVRSKTSAYNASRRCSPADHQGIALEFRDRKYPHSRPIRCIPA